MALTKAEKQIPQYVRKSIFNEIYASAEDAIKDALASDPANPKAVAVLGMLLDPTYSTARFATICDKVGMSIIEVVELFRTYKIRVGLMLAAHQAPQLIADTLTDALASTEYCKRCDGIGEIIDERKTAEVGDGKPLIEWRKCPACKGAGEVRKMGDKDAREMASKYLGLIDDKSAGNQFNQQINIGAPPPFGLPRDHEKLLTVAEKAVEVKVVEQEDDDDPGDEPTIN